MGSKCLNSAHFLTLLFSLCVSLIGFAPNANADGDSGPWSRPLLYEEQTVGSDRILVHYSPKVTTQAFAEAKLAAAEGSWAFFRDQLKFPEPASDEQTDPTRDGRLDIYIAYPELLQHTTGRAHAGGYELKQGLVAYLEARLPGAGLWHRR